MERELREEETPEKLLGPAEDKFSKFLCDSSQLALSVSSDSTNHSPRSMAEAAALHQISHTPSLSGDLTGPL
jgi:hypothetical protein